MRFISGLQVNENGDSVPGAFFHTPAMQAEANLRELQAQRLASVAASAEEKLAGGITEADIDKLCASGVFTTSQRLYIKCATLQRGEPLQAVLRKVRSVA